MMTDSYPVPVEQVARLIQQWNQDQKARLLQLVPDLQTIKPQESAITPKQEALLDSFEPILAEFEDLPLLPNDAPFVADLSVVEFFALSEAEQDAVWAEAHRLADQALPHTEYSPQADVVSTR
jgi:hypothetical protein